MSADETLPGVDVPKHPAGKLETAVRAAVESAQLDDRDKGTGELATSCARAVDLAHGRRDPYAVAAAARELRETLVALRMTPASRLGNDAGQIEQWLTGLGAE